ncbi:MAG TPA: NYN domain-containing protein [Candidatus Andersenbacteria bacterium]|nr:NYN domain-containing protein [Candidatus Andersenbacteria bacterium]
MKPRLNNNAYIDAANLHKGTEKLGWKMDYKRFRAWLEHKYNVQHAYIFIGLVPKYKDLYNSFQEAGFKLIFKEVTYDGEGRVKGNCDADLVLKATQDAYENMFNKAVLVSSDGDYAGLVKFLMEKEKFETIISPALAKKCSILLKRTGAKIAYLDDQRKILRLK